MNGATKGAFTVRLPADVKDQAAALASAMGLSMNRLVERLIRDETARAEERAWFDSFTLLGSDCEMADVSFALPAQSEVALRDE